MPFLFSVDNRGNFGQDSNFQPSVKGSKLARRVLEVILVLFLILIVPYNLIAISCSSLLRNFLELLFFIVLFMLIHLALKVILMIIHDTMWFSASFVSNI